jgi:hypothetical protein
MRMKSNEEELESEDIVALLDDPQLANVRYVR